MSSLGVVVPDTGSVFLLDLLFPCPGLKDLWDWLTLAPQAGASLLAISTSQGFQTQTSSGWRVYQLVPIELTYSNWGACLRGGLCAPTSPAPCPPGLSDGTTEVGCRRQLLGSTGFPQATPTLPGHACRGCKRPLPDPEVDHAQAEKEVTQAAPRFPVHSPPWSPGPSCADPAGRPR